MHNSCDLQRRGRILVSPVIQIAPFVDVVLVLLIIFMVTTPMMLSGVNVTLPKGDTEVSHDSLNNDPISITYAKDDILYIGDQQVLIVNLVKTINVISENNKDKPIFIRGDKMINYGSIMSVMHMLNNSGYKKVILVTEPANG